MVSSTSLERRESHCERREKDERGKYTSLLNIDLLLLDLMYRSLARVRMQVGIVNGCFWGTYGLAIADIYVYGPNLVGAAIAAVTSLVWFIYRVK
jgi:hypothetical protein